MVYVAHRFVLNHWSIVIYTNRVLLDPKTCATILSQRDLFFYKKKKLYTYLVVRIVENYGCVCLAKTQRVIEQRLHQLIFTLFFFFFSFAFYPVPGDKIRFLREEYIRWLNCLRHVESFQGKNKWSDYYTAICRRENDFLYTDTIFTTTMIRLPSSRIRYLTHVYVYVHRSYAIENYCKLLYNTERAPNRLFTHILRFKNAMYIRRKIVSILKNRLS